MSSAFSLHCIYLCCKVLYFILSDDDFEIKSKIYSFNLCLVLKDILHSQDDFFWNLSFTVLFLNCLLVMVFGQICTKCMSLHFTCAAKIVILISRKKIPVLSKEWLKSSQFLLVRMASQNFLVRFFKENISY